MGESQLPIEENILLSAYSSIAAHGQADPEGLVAEYERLFVTAVHPAQGQHGVFERFSLVDPTIQTAVKANTSSF